MVKAEKTLEKIKRMIGNIENIRNIGIAAHIDHGKTTLSDSLLAGAGIISEELAGSQLFMDFDKQEQERGITIYSANVSMVHDYEGNDYLINLIDTPGHVDFGGDVTRAMRAVDGVVVLIDAVEGAMPQTETVVRQALREKVKPVLFINKVDRLIKELKLSPEQMQERFIKHINKVNILIRKYASSEFKDEWCVDVNSGKVAFGSATKKWAISIPYMKKSGITFKEIIDRTNEGKEEELSKKAKLHEIILDMVIKHLPNPKEAQKYRIPKIWTGEIETEEGKQMINSDPDGEVVGVITNVTSDPHAGLVSTVRLFSGTVKEGDEVFLIGQQKKERIQQLGVFAGPRRIGMDKIPVGNIIAITGLASSFSGETICSPDKIIAPFESIKHVFEPVVTKSIEVKDVKDLPKLIEILRQRAKEDPTIHIKISEDTGETLVSALGELHIDAKIERYLREREIKIDVSKPIVIYKESVTKESREFEGKSPNKHNKFYLKVAPLNKKVHDFLLNGEIPEGKIRKQDKKLVFKTLVENEYDMKKAKKIVCNYKGNLLVDLTRGIVALPEVIELIIQSFKENSDEGPLAKEPVTGMEVMLMDAKLHEDSIHRGPAQVLPAVGRALRNGMVDGGALILEPKQILRIDCPPEVMGNVVKEIQNRRGQVIDMKEEEGMSILQVKLPVADMFGFEASLKSATEGRGFQSLVDVLYEKLPAQLQEKVILEIRKRKGLKEEVPGVQEE